MVKAYIKRLITPLITTHEPPSRGMSKPLRAPFEGIYKGYCKGLKGSTRVTVRVLQMCPIINHSIGFFVLVLIVPLQFGTLKKEYW